MIQLIFILMLIAGFIQEINFIKGVKGYRLFYLFYDFGAIFFIFWHEPYILTNLIYFLSGLSLIKYFAHKDESKLGKFLLKADPFISLTILVILTANYILYHY
jgi:hypothetical protein